MEVVALDELSAAEAEHIVVDTARAELRPQLVGARLRLGERACTGDAVEAAVVSDLQALERQELVDLAAQGVIDPALAREAPRVKCGLQRGGDAAAVAVAALARDEGGVDALPLRRALAPDVSSIRACSSSRLIVGPV